MHGFARIDAGVRSVRTNQYRLSGGCRGSSGIGSVSTQSDIDPEGDLSAGIIYTKSDTVSLRRGRGRRRTETLLIRTLVDIFAATAEGSGTMTLDDLTISLKRLSSVGAEALNVEQAASDETQLELGEAN